ncbi:unnamed protein product [Closterium sp. NIES-54]
MLLRLFSFGDTMAGYGPLRLLCRTTAASASAHAEPGFIATRIAGIATWRQMTTLGTPGSKESMKEELKNRAWPDKGTTIQEGAEDKAKAAKEAGYERAYEDAADIYKAEGVGGKLKQAGHMVADAAKGVGEMASKVADMGKEGMGRAAETARGLAGAAPPNAEERREKVDAMGKRTVEGVADAAKSAAEVGGQRGGS